MSVARLRRRVDFPGGPACVLSVGSAGSGTPPVLLLHGFAGDRLTWQFVLPALAADRPVLAVDLPGHGESTLDVGDGRVAGFAPWLERLLDALGVPCVHVVGHSMGGYVALCLAQRAPHRVASLSLVACAGLAPGADRALLRRLPRMESAETAAACVARLLAAPTPQTGRIARVLLDRAADPDRRAALERIVEASFADDPPPVDWAALAMPVQVLWGRHDRVIPLPAADRLPPGAPLHIFDNAGHLPHSECPGPVGAALRAFLADSGTSVAGEGSWSPR